jgi:hypothetical protein
MELERMTDFMRENFEGTLQPVEDYDTKISAVVVALINLCHHKVSRRSTWIGKKGEDTIKFVCNKFQVPSVRLLRQSARITTSLSVTWPYADQVWVQCDTLP